MEVASKLATLAKRTLPVSGVFDELIRAIGESKSKSEEDAIVAKLVELSKAKIREGRREPRTQKELLVYLIYIEMLGHDTGWAQAAAIQLCSDKNLAVKKLAYLAVSLLLEPSSELAIMVVATIQADLRSDNFLTVCTALSAICHIVSPELVGVFMPQVTALLRHDRDLVKKKALLALHRFIQVDSAVTPEVEHLLIDKIGYKEPSVMVASLCGLRELIRRDPAPYRNLVHYFTNILKQAAEGKLGRAYEYHRAPAPFVQLELLRLLGMLGAGDRSASENMYAVVAEVKRRAEPLGNNIGNALVYECIRTLTTIVPTPVLVSGAVESVSRFLASRENNLKYAGIDALTRLVEIDPKHAQDHQLAVVDCLRSPDVTLKRKTLQLLYKMAGPTNIEVIAGEVLGYLRESSDEVARRDAVCSLCDLAERFAPDHQWFVDTMNELFEVAGEVVPASLADNLTRLIAEGTGEEDEGADEELRAGAVEAYLELLDRPKLPPVLLKVICWVLGEYGRLASRCGVEGVMDRLAAIPEAQTADDEVRDWAVSALGKLAAQSGRPLTRDATALLEAAARAESVALQQRALEVQALLRAPAATQRAALPYDAAAEDVGVDPDLPFLESFVQQALQNGAAPYLSLEDRLAMGMTRDSGGAGLHAAPHAAALKFQAYAAAPPPQPRPAPAAAPAAAAASSSGAGNLDFGGLAISQQQRQQPAPAAAAAAATAPVAASGAVPAGSGEPQLILNKPGRKWGATAAPPVAAAPPAAAPAAPATYSQQQHGAAAAAPAAAASSAAAAPPPVVDAEKQRLAASLFGGGGSASPTPGLRGRRAAGASPAKPAAVSRPAPAAPDLLGGLEEEAAAAAGAAAAPQQAAAAHMDLLLGLDEPAPSSAGGSGPAAPAPAAAPLDPMAALAGLGGGMPAPPAAAPPSLMDLGDLMMSNGGGGMAAGALPGVSAAAPRAQQALGFGDLLGGPQQPATQQPMAAVAPLPGMAGGAAMASAGGAGQSRLPPPPKKHDPFADLLG
ncbi:hypothetical protein ABPG75_007958 [Micractinium tetrahymenae]